jgi:hypothetical protein
LQAAEVIGRAVFGIEPDRFGVIGNRVIGVFLDEVNVAAVDEGFDVIGIEPDCLVIVRDGAVVVLFNGVGVTAVVEGKSVIGI